MLRPKRIYYEKSDGIVSENVSMTVPPAMSPGGGDDGGGDDEGTHLKHQLMERRCNVLRQDNHRLLHRIYQVKRLTRMRKREVKFLMARLDMHGDNFRTVKAEDDLDRPSRSSGKSRSNSDRSAPTKRPTAKRKHTKSDKGDHVPAKRVNAFPQPSRERKHSAAADRNEFSRPEYRPTKQDQPKQSTAQWKLPGDKNNTFH